MRRSKHQSIIICVLFFLAITINAQSIKLISIACTEDNSKSLRESKKVRIATKKSISIMDMRVALIAKGLNRAYESYEIVGHSFYKEKIVEELQKIPISEEDIVILSLISHGFNTHSDRSKFPRTILYNEKCNDACLKENTIPFDLLAKSYFENKSPYMLLALVDACNDVKEDFIVENETIEHRLFTKNFDILYKERVINSNIFDKSGLAMISSTSKGERARITDNGSVYTNFFADKIYEVLTTYKDTDLDFMLNEITDLESFNRNVLGKKSIEHQNPFYVFSPTINQNTVPQRTTDAINELFGSRNEDQNGNIDVPAKVDRESFQEGNLESVVDYVNQANILLRSGKIEEAKKLLQLGLYKYPQNDDLKIGVFICEANLGYTEFTTMGNKNVCEIYYGLDTKEREFLERPEFVYLQYALGVNFLKGSSDCKKKPKLAARWLSISFNNGNKRGACSVLNRMGIYGCFDE